MSVTENDVSVSEGDSVTAEQVLGDGWSKTIHGTVTEIQTDHPIPHYDGTVVFVDTGDDEVPVRAENVERR